MIKRVPRELGRPRRLHRKCRREHRLTKLQDDPRPRVRGRVERTADASVVSPSEGNEARRNGRRGVGASHISVEAGERPFRTPRSEGDAASWTEGRPHAGDTEPRIMYQKGRRIVRGIAKPRRDEPDALIGHVWICGSPGGQSSGATRPFFLFSDPELNPRIF